MKPNLVVFFYPFEVRNGFVDKSKLALERLGYKVKKVSYMVSLSSILNRRNNITVLNWVEDQKYRRENSFLSAYAIFFGFLALIFLSKISSKKVIWIKHNLKPHNASGYAICHRLTCAWFYLLNIKPLTLEEYFGNKSVKHPLYFDDVEIKQKIQQNTHNKVESIPSVLFFGAIKPYKNLHTALSFWPVDLPLKIRGNAESKSYEYQLKKIIANRGLNVDWLNEFIDDDALNSNLLSSDFVLLPHSNGSMISSGSYYHSISMGCNVLCFDSEFARHKAKQFAFTHIFEQEKLSLSFLKKVRVNRAEVLRQSLHIYGETQITNSWKAVLA